MMKETIQKAINEQIKSELSAAYFYLSVAGYFEATNLTGFAYWMKIQSQEEVGHAMKFFNFLLDRGSRVTLLPIDQPPSDFQSPLDAFKQALQNEQRVTSQIHSLYGLSLQEQDYPAQVLLQWFVSEQVEEEKEVTRIIEELKLAGDNSSTLLLLNKALGTRRAEEATTTGEGKTSAF
jgi:ferritin